MGASKSASPLIQMANTLCGGNQEELANSINVFFQSVSAHLPPLTSTSRFFYAGSNIPDEYTISVDMLERQLMKLEVYKATGPDSIPAWLLRDFAPLVAPPLCAIFNSSIREGFVPSLWRTADVVPLPKKSPPSRSDMLHSTSAAPPEWATGVQLELFSHYMGLCWNSP